MTFDPTAMIATNEIDFQTQLSTWTPPNVVRLPRFSQAVKRVKANTGRAIQCGVGDSLTAGLGAGQKVGPTAVNSSDLGAGFRKDTALPAQCAALYNAVGIPARADAFFGDGNSIAGGFPQSAGYGPDANVDLNFPEGWQTNGANLTIGGHFFGSSNGVKATFYPQHPANRFDFFVILVDGGTPLAVEDADGTVLQMIPSTGSGLSRVTVTRPVNSTAPIRFYNSTASGVTFVAGIAPWSTVEYRLEIWNIGISGAQSQTFYATDGNEFTPGRTMQVLNDVDLFTIQLGQNERAKTAAQYRTDMETLITFLKAKSAGVDIQLVKTHLTDGGTADVQADKYAALDAIATAQSLAPCIDFRPVLRDSRDYNDPVHLAERGYRREAVAKVRAISTRI